MVKVLGVKEQTARLRNLTGEKMVRNVGRALFAGGQKIQVEAQISITTGAVSGERHVPSRPPEPPNNDTGFLANNIETNQVAPLKVEVSSNAPYSAHLEFGTSKMASRPFMARAVALKRKEVTDLIRKAVNHTIQNSKGA